jgi:hypothetical protein
MMYRLDHHHCPSLKALDSIVDEYDHELTMETDLNERDEKLLVSETTTCIIGLQTLTSHAIS